MEAVFGPAHRIGSKKWSFPSGSTKFYTVKIPRYAPCCSCVCLRKVGIESATSSVSRVGKRDFGSAVPCNTLTTKSNVGEPIEAAHEMARFRVRQHASGNQ